MSDYLERSKQLIGEKRVNLFASKKILVIGLGGVGGTSLIGLARSGFKNFIIVDCDNVDASNLNRQLLFTKKDIGRRKVDVAKEYLESISDDVVCKAIHEKIDTGSLDNLLKEKVDFIVDGIDFVPGKLEIYKYALKNDIPMISSLGMGNRIDPEKVFITTLNKTENDPFAKKVRYVSKQENIDLKKINVVFSKEEPLVKLPKPASMIMVPSTAGLLIVKYIVSTMK